MARACEDAGLVLLKCPPSLTYQSRETVSASAISQVVRRRGEAVAVRMLRVLADLDYGPVKADHIKAVDALLTDKTEQIAPDRLIRAIVALGIGPSEKEASVFAGTHQVLLWRGLVAVWMKAAKKTKRLPTDGPLHVDRHNPPTAPREGGADASPEPAEL